MFYFQKLLKENHFKNYEIRNYLSLTEPTYKKKLRKGLDFKMSELEEIKSFFVKKGVIPEDFDVGDLLNEVEK